MRNSYRAIDLSRAPENLGPQVAAIAGFLFVAIAISVMLLYLPLVAVVAVLFGVMFLVVCLVNPYAGLLGYLCLEYIRFAEWVPSLMPFHLQRVLAATILIGWLFSRLRKNQKPLVSSRQNLAMILFFIVMMLSAATAVYRSLAFNFALDFGKMVIIYLLITNLLNTQRRLNLFVGFYILLNAWIAAGVILSYHSGGVILSEDMTRAYGFTESFGDPNDAATMIAAALPFMGLLIPVIRNRLLKALLVLTICVCLVGIILTGSRGGSLALAAVVLGIWLTSRRKMLIGGLLVFMVVGMWMAAPRGYRERISTIRNYQNEASSVSRQESWKAGVQLFKKYPLWGVGAGGFGVARARYYVVYGSYADWQTAHSVYFQLLAELGILGLLCFGWIIFGIYKDTRFIKRRLRGKSGSDEILQFIQALEISLFGLLVGGAFLSIAYYPSFYILASLAVAQKRLAEENYPETETEITPAPKSVTVIKNEH